MVIKVLHIVSNMNRAGQETFLMNIYRAIDKKNVRFDFIVQTKEKCDYDDEIISLGGYIYHLPAVFKNPIHRFCELKKIVKDNQYHIVHRHSDKSIEWVDLASAKLGGAKILIYHAHNSSSKFKLVHFLCRPINNLLAGEKFACSKLAGQWVFGKRKHKAGKVTIIPNAIDVDKFRFNFETRKRVRDVWGLQNKLVIGHVGRFSNQKNHKFLVEIFACVHQQNPNTMLMLVGDGELKPEIEQFVKELELSNAVLFLGSRHDVHELYQAMDVFVLPSHYEGLPVVGIEAQCAGLPVLLSDNISNEVAITDLVHFQSLSDSVQNWAQNINTIIASAKRHNTREQIIEAGYTAESSANFLSKYYMRVIQTCDFDAEW